MHSNEGSNIRLITTEKMRFSFQIALLVAQKKIVAWRCIKTDFDGVRFGLSNTLSLQNPFQCFFFRSEDLRWFRWFVVSYNKTTQQILCD